MRRGLGALAAIVASAALAGCAALPGQTGPHPVVYSFAYGIGVAATNPGSNPPGANDFSCAPSAEHPNPVVLVHGTFGNMTAEWQALSALLANDEYCVFALDYGGSPGSPLGATGDIATSAAQLGDFVDRVLDATGASKVDIVGHSQGGMMPRWYIKFLGGDDTVRALVGLAPSNHGTTFNGLASLASLFGGSGASVPGCQACEQQFLPSEFIDTLNEGGDTVPGISYTVIATRYDEVVTPYQSQFLSGANVTNILLQDRCALDLVDHVGIVYDPVALDHVMNALDPANATPARCTAVLPVVGGPGLP
jgi:triacylglycerol esterase/lipase EstA (alpha/beta hydrolase family)